MKAIILCGGQGTRLREHTEVVPKPMVEIGGRPILWHIMSLYSAHGINDFVICLGYKGHHIRQFFLNFRAMTSDLTLTLGEPTNIKYYDRETNEANWRVTLVDTGENTMTGARLLRASKFIESDSRFCLTYGDGLSDVNLSKLIDYHDKHGALVTVTGVLAPSRFGTLEVAEDKVLAFREKPVSSAGLINGGFFVMERGFLEYLSEQDKCVLERDPLERCAADGNMAVYTHLGFWHCMDTYRDWLSLEQLWNEPNCPWRKKSAA